MGTQWRNFRADVDRAINGHRERWLLLPFDRGFYVVAGYRLRRGLFLCSGRWWPILNGVLMPLWTLLDIVGGCDVHYEADIGPGFAINHPALGVVVSGHATIGARCTMVGGNCVGFADGGAPTIGRGVVFGANAVVIGRVAVGDKVTVGAGAVVVRDVPGGATVVGVPAKPVAASVLH